MPKPSYLVRKMQAKERLRHDMMLNAEIDMALQLVQDAAFLAASDVFQMGPGRCEAFAVSLRNYMNQISRILYNDAKCDPEYVYTREQVDQRLKKICGDKFQPWEERYEEQKGRNK